MEHYQSPKCQGRTTVNCEICGPIHLITIDRPHVVNRVDVETARGLLDAFQIFARDADARVAVLTGRGEAFCAGADLEELAGEDPRRDWAVSDIPPMGLSRLQLSKPVIAAVEGPAIGGGLELALWCSLRVASETAIFSIIDRRRNLPLVDGGTVRLPRLIGQGRALDMIITGRQVPAVEARQIGLVNRIVPRGEALGAAMELARSIAVLPSEAIACDIAAAERQWALPLDLALDCEFSEAVSVPLGSHVQRASSEASSA
jgi:enoyl-CoA hydratase